MADMTSVSLQAPLTGDSVAFNGIFVVSFFVFLAIALFAQLLMWKWRPWMPGAEGEKSLIHGVKDAVYTFMSYLT